MAVSFPLSRRFDSARVFSRQLTSRLVSPALASCPTDSLEANRLHGIFSRPLLHASFLNRSQVCSRQVAERAGQKAIYDLQQQRVVAIIPGHHPYYHLLSEADRNDATSIITN